MSLIDKINDKSAKVGVIGLGYVGLPLAVEFSHAGYETLGVDIDKNKVNGCASQVWLDMAWKGPDNIKSFNIEGDSDALIVKGLIAILLSLYKGKTLVEAQAVDPRSEFEKLGLNAHLSSQRSNGLKSMIDQIKIFVNTEEN